MTGLVPLFLILWVPIVFAMYLLMPQRRAAMLAFVFGWLFLPVGGIDLTGLPPLDKLSVTSVAVVLAAVVLDSGRLMRFRPSWWDVPMLVWCVSPFVTSVVNGLGPYDGLANVLAHSVVWGLPYLLGRLYITDRDDVLDLARIVFIGGLVYVPLCLLEMRLSPQLHNWLYGYHPGGFIHTRRSGGFKPMVFLPGGLAVGIWMASASVVALVLWWSGAMRRLWGLPIGLWALPLWVTAVLCKSAGATLLMLAAGGLLMATSLLRTRVFLIAAIVTVPSYLVVRLAWDWQAENVVEAVSSWISPDRAESLQVRIDNESMVVNEKAGRPWFGWGGHNRNLVLDEYGQSKTTIDSMWIIAWSKFGLVGLISLYAAMLGPICRTVWHMRPGRVATVWLAPMTALTLMVWMGSMDKLLNAQPNPVFLFISGGLISVPWRSLREAAMRRVRVVEVEEPSEPAGVKPGLT